MRNAKLWSVLLASVLLCACVLGVLFVGANAETPATEYTVGTGEGQYASIRDALVAAKNEDWVAGSSLIIHFSGTDASANVTTPATGESANLLFGQTTIFREDGTKLPITIKGSGTGSATITAPAKTVAAANDYAFETLTYSISGASCVLYAGSGAVSFENVTFPKCTGYFYGDNFTKDAFAGWPELKDGERAQSSMSFLSGTAYDAGDTTIRLAAVGFTPSGHNYANRTVVNANGLIASELNKIKTEAETLSFGANTNGLVTEGCYKPINTEVTLTVEPKNTTTSTPVFCRLGVRRSHSPVAKSTLNARYGSGRAIVGDLNTTSTSVIDTYVGDMVINLDGWTCTETSSGICFRLLRGANLIGNLSTTIKDTANDSFSTRIGFIQLSNMAQTVISGTCDFTIEGGTVGTLSHVYSSASYGGTTNTIKGGTIGTASNYSFYAAHNGGNNKGTLGPITNIVTGGTFNGYFYGGPGNVGKIQSVTNKISGNPVFKSVFYGLTKGTVGSVTNIVEDGQFKAHFRGVDGGTVDTVTNKISGGTFSSFFNGYYHNTTLSNSENVPFPIKNVISGGVFDGSFAGSFQGSRTTCYGVKNEITGGAFNGTCYLLAYGGASVPHSENEIGGTASFTGDSVSLIGGSDTWPTVIAGAKTTITGGSFATDVYGLGMSCYATGDVETRIEGGAFAAKDKDDVAVAFYCGGFGSLTQQHRLDAANRKTYIDFDHYGKSLAEDAKLINVFGKENSTDGPSFNCNVYGGNCIGSAAKTGHNRTKEFGSIENTVYGGTFVTFYGGHSTNAFNGNGTDFVVTTEGGTTTYADVANNTSPLPVTDITNTIKGGTFNGSFFCASSAGTEGGVITNNVSGGSFVKSYYGGPASEGVCGSITNTVTGGEFVTGKSGNFIGAGASNSTTGTVTTKISGGIFHTDAYGGGVSGCSSGAIVNEISGNAEFKKAFYGGPSFSATVASITNIVTGGTFTDTFCGGSNYNSRINGDVVNEILGGTFKADYVGASKGTSDITKTVIGGDVRNTFKNCNFAATNANDYTVVCGAGNAVTIEGDVINLFDGGFTFNIYVYAGSGCAFEGNVINTINGGTFHGFWGIGGSQSAIHTGTVTNVINGGTFNKYGSNSKTGFVAASRNGKVHGTITTTINDGTFNGLVAVHAGYVAVGTPDIYHQRSTGDSTTTIKGGTFTGTIFKDHPYYADYEANKDSGDAKIAGLAPSDGTYVLNIVQGETPLAFLGTTVEATSFSGTGTAIPIGKNTAIVADAASGSILFEQTEGWLAHDYFTDKSKTCTLLVPIVTDVQFGAYEIDPDNKILRGKAIEGLVSNLVIGERITTNIWIPVEAAKAYGNEFTVTYTFNGTSQTLTLSQLEAGTKKTDAGVEYYVIAIEGIGLKQFGDEIAVSGPALGSKSLTINGLAETAETAWASAGENWVKLAKALQNLHAVYNGDVIHNETDYPITILTEKPTATPAPNVTDTFSGASAGLVMGDAAAVRFELTLKEGATAPANLSVKINGHEVDGDVVSVNGSVYTIDLYFDVAYMATNFTVKIYDAKGDGEEDDVLYLTYSASVEKLASQLATAPDSETVTAETRDNAKALLYYIQSAVACKKA